MDEALRNSENIRLGIMGTGRIARRFVAESRFVEKIEITAVYNPHRGSAEAFIEELWSDDEAGPLPLSCDNIYPFWEEVDAVYIATPHETHFSYLMEALFRGKHVLCEKPMCLSLEEARVAFTMAKSKNLVLMEAIKTVYAPGYTKMMEAIADGLIGRVRYIDACFTKLEDPRSRELSDAKYGGSFLELGSYVLLPMLTIFGTGYTALEFESMNNPLGIDIFTKADFRYNSGMATLTCGLGVKAEGRLLVAGESGYIVASAPWWKLSHFEVHFEDPSEIISRDCVFEGDGLRYELRHFVDIINGTEEEYTMEACSLAMAGIMERFLAIRNNNE